MKAVLAILLILLLFSNCTTSLPATPSPEIIGELQFTDDYAIGGMVVEIDGQGYLFLMTAEIPLVPSKATLHVLDLEDPASPLEVGRLAAPEDSLLVPFEPALSDMVLYIPLVGSDWGGLWVVDISKPVSPQEITRLDIGLFITDLVISESTSYLTGGLSPGRFSIIDISDPEKPSLIGEFRLSRERHVKVHNQDVEVYDSLLYIADRDGLDIVDISSPTSPREVGFYANPLWENEELDAVEPGVIIKTEEFDPEDWPPDGFQDIAVSGQYAYIAAGKAGLRVLDVHDPASPQEVAQLNIEDTATDVVVSHDLLYLLAMGWPENDIGQGPRMLYNLHVIDISEPASPKIVGSVEIIMPPLMPATLVASDTYVYLLTYTNILVIDIYGSGG